MHLVVDAMNVVGSRPDGWWRDRDAALARLVDGLRAAVTEGRLEVDGVVVVADGRPVTAVDPEPRDGVEVRWAGHRGPDAADDTIVALVAAGDPAPSSELTVVTSDADLARRVTAAGAAVEGAGAFRRRLGI